MTSDGMMVTYNSIIVLSVSSVLGILSRAVPQPLPALTPNRNSAMTIQRDGIVLHVPTFNGHSALFRS